MSTAVALSLTATGLTAVSSGPQLLRALRDVRGLSASAWLQSTALGALWGPTGWPPVSGRWWPASTPSPWAA